MASLFIHNTVQSQQLTFSQLASFYHGLRTYAHSSSVNNRAGSKTKSPKQQKSKQNVEVIEKVLSEGLVEDLLLKSLPKNVTIPQLVPLFNTRSSINSTWRQSHKSSNSFFENKNGFSKSSLDNPIPAVTVKQILNQHKTLNYLLRAGLFNPLFQQSRGFVTEKADTSSGMGKVSHGPQQEVAIGNIFRRIMPDSKKPDELHKDEIQKLVDKYKEEPDIQDNLKVAFAEGYSASKHSKGSSEGTFVKSFRYVLMVGYLLIGIVLLVSLAPKGGLFNGLLSNQYVVSPEKIDVTFADVKGSDEAKEELEQIVYYLRDPQRYTALGAKLPKGVLLVGPPGIGKTLLARAVAGEAGVPFFQAAGSEFDELFVGSGARKIRDLFKMAKNNAPCVVFIDEIDSVGQKRTSSTLHPYANQTVNQLLSEMDGFVQNEGVIVIGATNKKDNLDAAILRAGRFDVEVQVHLPDVKGRKELLELYLSKVICDSFDIDELAQLTRGFTGADISNLVNQAALQAAIEGFDSVTMKHMEFSREKVSMGPAKKSKIPDEKTNWNTAYHEAGHALVAYFNKSFPSPNKITIIPRGQALGYTAFIEEKEIYNYTKSELLAQMDVCMGGRIGEEIIYGSDNVTTGAADDFKKATAIAVNMVKNLGLSDKLGPRVIFSNDIDLSSPALKEMADHEINKMLEDSYERAKKIVQHYSKEHKALAEALMKHESLDKDQIEHVLKGKKLPVVKS